jgi:DNA-binding transcriptional LysR family regulator
MALNLNSLRLFEAVARTGSFTRAADDVHVSQPAISKAVREIERSLGVALFERSARGARLTQAGEILAEQARTLFGLARAAEEEMRAFAGLGRGTLRIGASTTIATYLLPPLLGRFTQQYPGIDLCLVSANTLDIVRQLVAYELDVALVEGPVSRPGVRVTRWREDELVLIAPAEHPLTRLGRAARWSEVAREPLLVREPGSGTGEVVATALAARRLMPSRTRELGSTEAIKQAVAAGLGLAFVSHAAAEDQLALGKLAVVRVAGLEIRRHLSQLTLPGRRQSAVAQAFRALLKE